MKDTSGWEKFKVGDILECKTCPNSVKIDLNDGDIPYISRTALNNGCDGFVNISSEKISKGNCITIGAEGLYAFYQNKEFATGVKIYNLRNEHLNREVDLFLCTLLNLEIYRYNYGRARILEKIKNELIKLPIQFDKNNSPIIDKNKKYHKEGYIPDWKFMKEYIEKLENVEKKRAMALLEIR